MENPMSPTIGSIALAVALAASLPTFALAEDAHHPAGGGGG